MTTCLVVRKGPRAVLCADTLATYGEGLEPAPYVVQPSKIVPVANAVLAPTGPAAMQLILQSYFSRPQAPADFSSPIAIFDTMRAFYGALVEDYALTNGDAGDDPFDPLPFEMLIANPSGIFGVYPLRSVQAYTRFYAMGSGAEYAMGAMQAVYPKLSTAEDIARAGIEAAAQFDPGTALPFTISKVSLDASAESTPPEWAPGLTTPSERNNGKAGRSKKRIHFGR